MLFGCNCDRGSLSSSLWLGRNLNIVCLRIPSWSSVRDYFAECCSAIANLVGCVSSGNRCILGIAIAKRLHENRLARAASIPSNSGCNIML